MRVLLSTYRSLSRWRAAGDALSALRNLGQEVRLCVPPEERDWIESLEMPLTLIGPFLRSIGKASLSAPPPEQVSLRQLAQATVATQFETIVDRAWLSLPISSQ